MFDFAWVARGLAVLIALVALGPGAVEAALEQIRSGAAVNEWAERGDSSEPNYRVPVADVDRAGWGETHAAYEATDIFLPCGAELLSPAGGEVSEVRRIDSYDAEVDNPATRGGRSVTIIGDDGVRYYLAHFDTIVDSLTVGDRLEAGNTLGTMGDTGRTSACHLHFGISPPCPDKEWSVRRGVVWPHPYLDAWRRGEQLSPVDEVEAWAAANPTACAAASADPFAADS